MYSLFGTRSFMKQPVFLSYVPRSGKWVSALQFGGDK